MPISFLIFNLLRVYNNEVNILKEEREAIFSPIFLIAYCGFT